MSISKNKEAIICATINALLALFAQQLASGTYPQIPPDAAKAVAGLVALAIAAVTAFSPYFDIRQARK